jgi:hypothetical protein
LETQRSRVYIPFIGQLVAEFQFLCERAKVAFLAQEIQKPSNSSLAAVIVADVVYEQLSSTGVSRQSSGVQLCVQEVSNHQRDLSASGLVKLSRIDAIYNEVGPRRMLWSF